jgi:diguanylate cyclase (GGDEF)-like protein
MGSMTGTDAHFGERDRRPAPERVEIAVGELQPLLRALASARSTNDASEAVCEHLASLPGGLMPSVYFERDGLLRCESQRGYGQVLDGIKLDSGVLARVFGTGQAVTLDDMTDTANTVLRAVPDLIAETCVPLWIRGRVVGVLNVESASPFEPGAVDHVASAGGALSSRLEQVWVEQAQSPLERLARTSRELTGLVDEAQIRDALVRLAGHVIGMSSAVLVMTTGDGALRVVAAHGPLSTAFQALSPVELGALRDLVSQASSWYTKPGARSHQDESTGHLRAAGVVSLAAVPMRGLGGVDPAAVVGLLATADDDDVPIGTEDIEALELLGDEGARCLQLACTVDDLRARASRDPLTGLGNHRLFHETLAAAEHGGRADWSVLVADLDGFKEVNDRHGHLRGDEVLRDLASALQVAVRAGERVFRIGGDEFALVLRSREPALVRQVAVRLCDAASAVLRPYGASMSIGAALARPGETCVMTLERADRALYAAKRTAPGTIEVAEI